MRKTLAIAAVAGLALTACGSSENEPQGAATADGRLTLKIGYSGARSGAYAAYDEPVLNGMRFAADELKRKGGKVKVQVEFKDNRGDQQQASQTMQQLLDDGIRTFVLTTGDANVAQGQLGASQGAVMALGGSTAPQWISDIGEGAFLFAFGDNTQTSAMAEQACKDGRRRAWVLGSKEIPFTAETPDYFADAFKRICGGEVVGRDTFKIGQTEFNTQVTKIRGAKPDVIFTAMFVPDSGAFLKALRGAGVQTPFLGLDGNDSPLFAKSAGKAVDGAVYSTHAFATDGNVVEQFNAAYEKATGKAPESVFEAIGRDHVYAFAAAAERANSTEPEKLREAVSQLKGLKLVTGDLTMDPKTRIPRKTVTLVEMNGSEPTFKDRFVPGYVAAP